MKLISSREFLQMTFNLDNCNVDKSRKTLMWKWCVCTVACCSKPVYVVLCVIEPGCICFKLKTSQSVTNIFSMKVKMIRIQNWICRRLNCPQIWGQLEKTTFRELLLKPNWFLDPGGKGTNWCELGLELVMRSCHAVIGSWGWSMTNAMVTNMRSLGRSSGYLWCQSLQAITQEYELLGDLKQWQSVITYKVR